MSLLQYTSSEMFSSTELIRKSKMVFDKIHNKDIEKAIILRDGKPNFILIDFEIYENIMTEYLKLKEEKKQNKISKNENKKPIEKVEKKEEIKRIRPERHIEEINSKDLENALNEIEKIDIKNELSEVNINKEIKKAEQPLKEFWEQ